MEVYIDDMLVKNKILDVYIQNLKEVFVILIESMMRINPKKCTFGVQSGKFLGHVVSKEGFQANPNKVEALRAIHPPRNVKEV